MTYDLIIIGGGPAGMTAGIYAARLNLKTLLITKSFGGQMAKKAVAIENYPGFESISGLDLVQRMEKHLKSFTRQNFVHPPQISKKFGRASQNLGGQVDIKIDEVRKVEKRNKDFIIFTKSKKEFQAKSVILASGADPRPLEVPGEKEFIGKGVSYCSVCDGPLFKNKTVVVIGGGNAGFETAIFLANIAKKIYILEFGPEVKAFASNQEIIKKAGKTEVITNAALKEIKGNGFVDSIVYEDRKTGKEKTLKVQGVFVEIGSQPATSYVKGLVDFNERDEIKVEFETCQTKTQGLFAAGDLNIGAFKQIVTACGEGAKAVLAAYNYIQALANKAS